jgi:hypothetical protein
MAVPLLEETSGGPAGAMIAGLAGLAGRLPDPALVELLAGNRPLRRLAIYAASAGFDLVDELAFLSTRTIESNIFFNPYFLAPAMPRLDDREVRLAVMRDGNEYRSRLRLLVPFSIEQPPVHLGIPIIRTWANPFGPLGTPLLDHDDPVGVIEDFFEMLSRSNLKMPQVLMLPEMRLDGPVAGVLRTVAGTRGLPLIVTGEQQRAFLQSSLDGDAYLKKALSKHHAGEYRRLKRRLSEQGTLAYSVVRRPDEIRPAMERFLALEAAGWKGRERTAMAIDRYRAAFAREAVNRLAEQDMCRVHALTLDGRLIASLIVFIEAGVAYTWKTAYDESFSAYSPGTLLMIELTKNHLEDPNIEITDSCAVPDHPVASRLWMERRTLGTLVVGLSPGTDRITAQAASQLHLYRETRDFAKLVRRRLRRLLKRR